MIHVLERGYELAFGCLVRYDYDLRPITTQGLKLSDFFYVIIIHHYTQFVFGQSMTFLF